MSRTVTKTYKYQPALYFDSKTRRLTKVFRPLIPIKLSYQNVSSKFSFDCVLDSGADINLFPQTIAQSLGINVEQGKKTKVNGIGDVTVEAYRHQVTLIIDKNISFTTDVFFSPYQEIPLLGREGFFAYFTKITFFEKKKQIEVEFNTKSTL